MAIIGITGSIASGKSTFRDLFAPILPAQVMDADAIARKFLEEDLSVREEVQRAISSTAYTAEGGADRAEIRRIIYSDPAAKARLEAILHPRVRRTWMEAADLARQENQHMVVDIPLLFETGAEQHFDITITVACSPGIQMVRLAARGMDATLAQKIIRTQMPTSEKIARSGHVVWNDGQLSALRKQADYLARWIRDRDE
ncbi:MAG: dephospho-CoA kinase [Terrimicrobiaceae bacterium]